jgi:hypothetical protein
VCDTDGAIRSVSLFVLALGGVSSITIISRGENHEEKSVNAPPAGRSGCGPDCDERRDGEAWKITEDFTIAVAKTMPAKDYSFRPVPVELSVAGEQPIENLQSAC